MLRFLLLTSAILALGSVQSANIVTNAPYWGQKYTDISSPRGLLLDDAGDVLVVSSSSVVTALYENQTEAGTVVVKTVVVDGAGLRLNHGIAYSNGFLYVSSTTTVYRYPYTPGQRTQVRAEPETVITGIPSGGHATRTLIFDDESRLYVSVGSNANIDANSDRARIRRFNVQSGLPLTFVSGEVFADGLRNEVGMDFDLKGTLFGVENGADQLNRPDIGGDVHNGNPAEDFNKFDQAVGTFYGYPYCFASYDLAGYERGTQFAWPTTMNDGTHSDAWCRNTANNRPPALAMPAHHAPLGVKFNRGESCDKVGSGAFPCENQGDAVVAFHGSWNASPPKGYKVVLIPFNKQTQNPVGDILDVIYEENPSACAGACFRPVNAIFNKNGHLIISCDSTNAIYRVTYDVPAPKIVE